MTFALNELILWINLYQINKVLLCVCVCVCVCVFFFFFLLIHVFFIHFVSHLLRYVLLLEYGEIIFGFLIS